jgi:hypothetical protein
MATQSGTSRGDGLLLSGLFLLAVVGCLAYGLVRPEWRANVVYVEGRCVVLDKRLIEKPSRKAANSTYRAEFLVRHTVDGRDYEAWTYDAATLNVRATTALRWPKERLLESYDVGQEYPCWYDPADPAQVVLVRGYSCFSYCLLAGFLLSLSLITLGALRRIRATGHPADTASGATAGPSRVGPGA